MITIPLLFLFITCGGIVVFTIFNKYFGDSPVPLAVYLGIMALAIDVGFRSSYKIWQNEKCGILDRIREMKGEFGGLK